MKKLILALPLALLGAVSCVDRDRDVYIEKKSETITTSPNAVPGRGEGERETAPSSSSSTTIIEAEPAQPSDDQLEGAATGTDADMEVDTELEGSVDVGDDGIESEGDAHTGHDTP